MFTLTCLVCADEWKQVGTPAVAADILEEHYRHMHPTVKSVATQAGKLVRVLTLHEVRRMTGTPA